MFGNQTVSIKKMHLKCRLQNGDHFVSTSCVNQDARVCDQQVFVHK